MHPRHPALASSGRSSGRGRRIGLKSAMHQRRTNDASTMHQSISDAPSAPGPSARGPGDASA
eukprot:286147-Pyramimonas_sp.AAC.1